MRIVRLDFPLDIYSNIFAAPNDIIKRCIYLGKNSMAHSTPETPQPDKKELTQITAKPQEEQEEPPNKGDGRK
ncbi:hypothetical protein [Microcoleus sp. AT3-D2]|uniref:hypothetical protein n=1 Tax=Microcoleus sp. AT3-D2 TaxID=2818612 RepID=UPI002FD485B4